MRKTFQRVNGRGQRRTGGWWLGGVGGGGQGRGEKERE